MTLGLDLGGRVVAVTGGAGLLGVEHAAAIAEAGGVPVLLDLDGDAARRAAERIGGSALGLPADVTDERSLDAALRALLAETGRLDGLVNNAARNPKVEGDGLGGVGTRLETMPLADWDADLRVGLTGAFLAARVLGAHMAANGGGAVVNVASDLALISPDQRLYRVDGVPEHEQPVKPVTYSVVKTGLIGLTRWLATYWAQAGVRVNAISPGGVANDQPEDFVRRLAERIPLGRMARPDEYRAAIAFLLSDASSYMTGQNLVVDGGRTVW